MEPTDRVDDISKRVRAVFEKAYQNLDVREASRLTVPEEIAALRGMLALEVTREVLREQRGQRAVPRW